MTPKAGKGSADYRHHTTMGLADYRRAGSSEGYPPEMVAMLQKCQAVRKHEVPRQGAGRQEGIGDSKKPPKNSSIRVFRWLLSCNAIKAIALMAIHLSFLVSNASVQAL